MTSDTKRIWDLIQKLVRLSDLGKVDWQTTAEEDVYQVSFARYSVEILQRTMRSGAGLEILIRLRNDNGVLIEEVSDEDLEGVEVPFKAMKGLLSMARAKALGVNSAIEDVMSALNFLDDDPF